MRVAFYPGLESSFKLSFEQEYSRANGLNKLRSNLLNLFAVVSDEMSCNGERVMRNTFVRVKSEPASSSHWELAMFEISVVSELTSETEANSSKELAGKDKANAASVPA